MGERFSTISGFVSGARVAAAAIAASLIAACASDPAPQRASASADHLSSGYLPRDMGAAERAVMASLRQDNVPGLSYRVAAFQRAAMGAPTGAASAHEAGFAQEAPAQDKLNNAAQEAAPARILIQNKLSPALKGGWREVSDALIHDHSGMRCPKAINMILLDEDDEPTQEVSVPLTGISLYDEEGFDTGCNYTAPDPGIYYTLYASRWPDVSLEDHFGAALSAMVQELPFHKEAPVLVANAERKGQSTNIEGETLAAGFITQPIEGETYKTAVWLNKTGPWHVKARLTFNAELIMDDSGLSLVEMVATTMHAVTLLEVDAHQASAQTVSFESR